jgi:hypothetical protein
MVAFDDLASSDAMADIRRSNFHHDTNEGETDATESGSLTANRRIFRDRLYRGGSIAMIDISRKIETIFDEAAARSIRRQKVNNCPYCKAEGMNFFHPPHDASERCESGKRNHCSCDLCF